MNVSNDLDLSTAAQDELEQQQQNLAAAPKEYVALKVVSLSLNKTAATKEYVALKTVSLSFGRTTSNNFFFG